jgi:hypothetical protein
MSLERDPSLNLAQLRQILAPVIELSRSRIGMIRHLLRCFDRAAITKKHRHARTPKCVIAGAVAEFRRGLDIGRARVFVYVPLYFWIHQDCVREDDRAERLVSMYI